MEIYQKILDKLKAHKKIFIVSTLLILVPAVIVALAADKQQKEKPPAQPEIKQATQTPKERPVTIGPSITSTEDQIRKQKEADENFHRWEEEIDKTYPWLESLPIQTEGYYVYFDLDKKAFVGLLYPKTSSSESIDGQVNKMKKEIIASLTGIGVATSQYQFEWTVSPKP